MQRRTVLGLAGLGVAALVALFGRSTVPGPDGMDGWSAPITAQFVPVGDQIAAVLSPSSAHAFDTTARLGLQRPSAVEQNWHTPLNFTIDRIDQFGCFPGINCSVNLGTETVGLLPVNRLVDSGTGGQCLLSGGAAGDPAYGTCPGGGGTGAPTDATYITQTANATLSNEQPLSVLSDAIIMKSPGGVLVTYPGSACVSGTVVNTISSFGSTTCLDPILQTEMDSFLEWRTLTGVSGTCDNTTFIRGDGICATPVGGGGSSNAWATLNGDSGTATAGLADTLTVVGGPGLTTQAANGTPDTLIVALAPTEVSQATWGNGTAFTWTWDSGPDPDPTLTFNDAEAVFNINQAAVNVRVSGLGAANAQLLLVDASGGCIGIRGPCSGSGATVNIAGSVQATGFTGNATTATALAANGANCGAGQAAAGVDGAGNAEGCFTPLGGGSGDVVGPAVATDNAVTRFDSTTGKLIQNSTCTLSDIGMLTCALTGAVTGNATTATALAADGANCAAGQAAAGVDAVGGAQGCFTPAGGGSSAFSALTSGTNTLATMLVDGAALLSPSGTGIVRANRVPDGGTTSLVSGSGTGQVQVLDTGRLEWTDGNTSQRRSILELNVLDFGATPFFGASGDGTSDDTTAFRLAIGSCPGPLATSSGTQELGCVVRVPAGKYRLGTTGQSGMCCGGNEQGTLCVTAADCAGGPPAAGEATPTCAWVTTNGRPVSLVGEGMMTTEIGVMDGGTPAGQVNALAICTNDNYSSIEDLRLIKIQNERSSPFYTASGSNVRSYTGRPYANGIVMQAISTTLRNLTIEGFGGHAVFVDGEGSVATADGARIEQITANLNAGDGLRIWSHAAWPTETGVGNANTHTILGVTSLQNWGYGVWLRSSRNTVFDTELSLNGVGGFNISGNDNLASGHCEAGSVSCIFFDADGAAVPMGNRVWDQNAAVATTQGRLTDEGIDNVVSTRNLWTKTDFLPLDASHQPACAAGDYFVFADGQAGQVDLELCENGSNTPIGNVRGPTSATLNGLPVYANTNGMVIGEFNLNAICTATDTPADCCTGNGMGNCVLDVDATTGEIRAPFGWVSQARATGNCSRQLEPPAQGTNFVDECVPDSGLTGDFTRTVRADGRYNPVVVRSTTVGTCAQFNATTGDLEPASAACGTSTAADVVWFPPFGPSATAEVPVIPADTCRCWLYNIPYTMNAGVLTAGYDISTADANDVATLGVYTSNGMTQVFAATLAATPTGSKSVGTTVGSPPATSPGQHIVCVGADDATAPAFRLRGVSEQPMYGGQFDIACTSGALPATVTVPSPVPQITSFAPPAIVLSATAATTTSTTSSTSTSSTTTTSSSTTSTTSGGSGLSPTNWETATIAAWQLDDAANVTRLNNAGAGTCGGTGTNCDLTDTNGVALSTANICPNGAGTADSAICEPTGAASFTEASNEVLTCTDATCAALDLVSTNMTFGCILEAGAGVQGRDNNTIISKGDNSANGYSISLDDNPGTQNQVYCQVGTAFANGISGNAPQGVAISAICSRNQAGGTIQLYVNGRANGAQASGSNLAATTIDFTLSSPTATQDWDGPLDTCFVDNAEYTANQINRVSRCNLNGNRCCCDVTTTANYRTCTTDADCQVSGCPSTGLCDTVVGRCEGRRWGTCAGGANVDFACSVDGDCPSSTCTVVTLQAAPNCDAGAP